MTRRSWAHGDLQEKHARQVKHLCSPNPVLGTSLTFRSNRQKASGAVWLTSGSWLGARVQGKKDTEEGKPLQRREGSPRTMQQVGSKERSGQIGTFTLTMKKHSQWTLEATVFDMEYKLIFYGL